MRPNIQFKRFFSVESAKAIKATKYGFLNGINYMAPADTAGVGNLCPFKSAGCAALCLGIESGQAAMVSRVTGTNSVRESRKAKARYFMKQRQAYLAEALWHVATLCRSAAKLGLVPVARMNGSTDIAYENMRFFVTPEYAATLSQVSGHTVTSGLHTVYSAFPSVTFCDYTKIAKRFDRALPKNLSLTFSRSETNEAECIALLVRGFNVAVVFDKALPRKWNGFVVINGDEHDLRHLDPKGVVVGLLPKGNKAKRDTSGFVVRAAA
jgi:hypothetical protein